MNEHVKLLWPGSVSGRGHEQSRGRNRSRSLGYGRDSGVYDGLSGAMPLRFPSGLDSSERALMHSGLTLTSTIPRDHASHLESAGMSDIDLQIPETLIRRYREPIKQFMAKDRSVAIYEDKRAMSMAAADAAGRIMRERIDVQGICRIIVSAAPSQAMMINSLVERSDIDWSSVVVFHHAEYLGVSATHPASLRRWLKTHLVDRVHPKATYGLHGDIENIEAECERYGELLAEDSIDLCLADFGENGRLGFNDPHEADFHDPCRVKSVALDRHSRMQQIGEGHFPCLRDTLAHVITLTCPTLLKADHVICCVPDYRKANAVKDAIEGPLTTQCPASQIFTHAQVSLFLDTRSAALLECQRD